MSEGDGKGLPPGWVAAMLANVGVARMGKTILAKELVEGSLPVYSAGRDNKPWGYVGSSDLFFGDSVVVLSARGSIGFPKLPRMTPFVCTQTTIAVDFQQRAAAEFYTYWLATVDWERLTSGGSIPMLTVGVLNEQTVPVPPTNEQKRIVAKIEALQARSEAAKEALDAIPPLLEKFRQSVLAAAFRGDLTKKWREAHPDVEPASELLKRIRAERRRRWEEANPKKKYTEPEPVDASDLPALPKGWCWASLDELLLDIVAGKSPKAEGRPAGPGEMGVLKVSAVSWGEFNPKENKALLEGGLHEGVPTVAKNDLLISRANTVELVGAVVLVRADYPNLMLCDKTLRLDIVSCLDKEYVLRALRTAPVRAVFEEQATGTSDSMRNLSHSKIRAAPIPIAPVAEQAEIVTIASSALDIGAEQGRRLTELSCALATLNQSILAKAFRGELVPQDPSDEPASALLARIQAARAAGTGTAKRGRRS